jgi:ATP-dependent protease Clp ATPase subunit
MLKVVEGDTFVMKDGTTINTHKMLFVFMGSFSGLKGLKKGDISDEALKEYGMIDELRGRISGFFTFKKATEETYRRILVNPNTSPLEAAKLHLRQIPYALRINFTEAAINELASYALLLETGARSLDRCVDKIKQHLIKNIRSLRTAGGSEVVVDASMVRAVLGEKPHILVEEEEEDWGERYRRLGIFM